MNKSQEASKSPMNGIVLRLLLLDLPALKSPSRRIQKGDNFCQGRLFSFVLSLAHHSTSSRMSEEKNQENSTILNLQCGSTATSERIEFINTICSHSSSLFYPGKSLVSGVSERREVKVSASTQSTCSVS